jgi:hypothetical protein
LASCFCVYMGYSRNLLLPGRRGTGSCLLTREEDRRLRLPCER